MNDKVLSTPSVGPRQAVSHAGGDVAATGPLSAVGRSAEELAASSSMFRRGERLDAAYEEYCQRLQQGEVLDAAQFCEGFPDLAPSLQRQIEVHHLIAERSSFLRECCRMTWPSPGDRVMGLLLIEELGRGAFSRVFLALDLRLGERQVVAKLCYGGSHEAWILGKLEHAGIVPIHSIRKDKKSELNAICMPYCGRATLRDVIQNVWRGPSRPTCASEILGVILPARASQDQGSMSKQVPRVLRRGSYVEGVVHIAVRMADALDHAHRQGILHLDLKPSNVLLGSDGLPRLLDFNLAAEAGRDEPRVGGTVPYMSPEQLGRCLHDPEEGSLDCRSDVYSLGVILHEMLTGELPFGEAHWDLSSDSVAKECVMRRYSGLIGAKLSGCGVDKRMHAILHRCLAFDPGHRYHSSADLAADLRHELSAARAVARRLRARPRLTLAGIAITAVMTAGVMAGWAARPPYPLRELELGLACLAGERYQDSVDHLTRSLLVTPDQAEALFARAQAHVALANYHDAIRDLLAANSLRRSGEQYALLGYCCNRVRSHAEAVVWYDLALAEGFQSPGLFNNLGFSHYRNSRVKMALTALDRAVASHARPDIALFNRAVVRLDAACRDNVPPTEAILDVQALVSLGHCANDVHLLATDVHAHATKFEGPWTEVTSALLRQTLRDCVPGVAFASDEPLNPLNGAALAVTGGHPSAKNTVKDDAERLINPLD